MMSHEVNNTVGAVGSLLDSFRAYGAALAGADRDDFTGGITVAIARLESLRSFTNGFAEVVRLPPPEPRPTDLAQLVDELLILLRPELERRRIEVRWLRAEAMGPIALDRNQVERVLVNVLKNAMEAMTTGGKLAIRVRADDDSVFIRIADTGAGIKTEDLSRLFSPYHTTKSGGHGLGLMIVQRIMRDHGGHVGIESKEGVGTVVTLQFPQLHRRVKMLPGT
jgi:signal transduction histidine kinase